MSVSVQGFTVDPHTIRDQETQQPKPWTSIVSAEKANGLAKVLKARVEGEVRFDDMSRALYSTDASNYRQVPIGVVIPKTIDDVVTTIACCREYGAPFLSRGGGTSLCGQSCNAAVMADFSKYLNRIIGIDFEKKLARVQPGCNLDILRNAAEKHHLTFGPDPSTHDHNTLGGMMGNNSCGVHSVYAGRTADNVEELDIVTYRGLRLKVGRTSPSELRGIIAAGGAKGEIYRRLAALRDRYADLIRRNYPKIPRRVSGYNLDELLPENGFNVARALIGSEGTCVIILEATLNLVRSPPKRAVAVIAFPDIYQAGDAAAFVRDHGPIGLEAMDDKLIEFMRDKHADMSSVAILPPGDGWLIAEFGGETENEAKEKAKALETALKQRPNPPHIKVAENEHEQQLIWKAREAGLGSTAFVPHHPDAWEGSGGRSRSSGAPWKLPARVSQAARPLRLRHHPLRPFRRRLRSLPHRFRPSDQRRTEEDAPFPRRCGVPRRGAWRVDFRGAWRRPVQGRAPTKDVRAGTDRGVPRVQVHLGSGLEDEPRQGRRSLPHHLEHAAWPGLCSAPCSHPFQLPERRGKFQPGGDPLRRRRQMPVGCT
ncbi:MAG: FAD-binding oxidoreductase, partial [Rhodomicrobium sp.]